MACLIASFLALLLAAACTSPSPTVRLPWAEAIPGIAYDSQTGLPRVVYDTATRIELVLVVPNDQESRSKANSLDSLRPFYLSKYEISVDEWERLLEPVYPGRYRDLPVWWATLVSARQFAKRAGMRLPSRGEYDYVASVGLSGTTHKDGLDPTWHETHCPFRAARKKDHSPDGLGLCGVFGGVLEWCDDGTRHGGLCPQGCFGLSEEASATRSLPTNGLRLARYP